MKLEFDSTIDSLLRQHGRRAPTRAVAGQVIAGPHLDADEMNAYAENALPPATRTRYMAHLADCTACRQTVTQLALAANPVFAAEPETVAATSVATETQAVAVRSWRARLAEWFAPSAAWRYAVPALAVAVLSVAAFVALQSNRALVSAPATTETVARNEGPTQQTANPAPSANNTAPAASASPLVAPSDNANTLGTPSVSRDKEQASAPVAVAPENPAAAPSREPSSEAAPDGPAKTSAKAKKAGQLIEAGADSNKSADVTMMGDDNDSATTLAAPSVRAEVAPASPAPAMRPATTQPADSGTRERDEARNTDAMVGRAASGMSAQKRITPKPAPPPIAPAPKKPRQDEGEEKARQDKKDADDREAIRKNEARTAATRTVGGRNFTRRGGVWVDQACDKGCNPRTLSRSSDDYKQADAELRRIVDQLGGTVIIVWRGQALRVQ